MSQTADLDLDALEQRIGAPDPWMARALELIPELPTLIQRLREAFKAIESLEARIAQLERVREVAVPFGNSTWTGQSFDALRAALADSEEGE